MTDDTTHTTPYRALDRRGRLLGVVIVTYRRSTWGGPVWASWRWAGQRTEHAGACELELVPATWPRGTR